MRDAKVWNTEVAEKIDGLEESRKWLRRMVNDNDLDWESQKSAHQALKFIELAEFEMWNMQYWTTDKQKKLYNEGEDTVC
jgi:hypothetical protein